MKGVHLILIKYQTIPLMWDMFCIPMIEETDSHTEKKIKPRSEKVITIYQFPPKPFSTV